jgi:hypothetical protein
MHSARFREYSVFKDLGWQWTWFVDSVPRPQLLAALLASDRSEAGLFDAFMRLYADQRGGAIVGEKTPIHLRWAEELLSWYPGAKIVHMMRDPRGVHVSDLKRRKEQEKRAPVYEFLRRLGPIFEIVTTMETSIMWGESARQAERLSAKYPGRYLVVRFEDLVRDPNRVVRDLCAKLCVPFEEKMLERTVVSEGFRKGSKGFDQPAAERWSKHISGWAATWYQRRFRKELAAFGYTTNA